MRVKVGPGKWVDHGPASATRGSAIGGGPALGARNVGFMLPDVTTGVTPQVRSDGGTHKLGLAPISARRWNGNPK